jgi:hypothetical protein
MFYAPYVPAIVVVPENVKGEFFHKLFILNPQIYALREIPPIGERGYE